MSIQKIRECLRDIDPEFIQAVATVIAWEYDRLYEELRDDDTLPHELKCEIFGRRRMHCALRALIKAAKEYGVPYEFRRLTCNGQHKLLLKIGRVVLMQEPMLTLNEAPRASEYKRQLADTYGLIRQLELDLGDQPNRIRDWGGGVLGVVLHGAAGPQFTREDRALGGLMLGVPDAAYTHWVVRLDLHRIAMHGIEFELSTAATAGTAVQPDKVEVTLKDKAAKKKDGAA